MRIYNIRSLLNNKKKAYFSAAKNTGTITNQI